MKELLSNIPSNLHAFIAPQIEQLEVVPSKRFVGSSDVLAGRAGSRVAEGKLFAAALGDCCLITVHDIAMKRSFELVETPNDYGCICSVSEAALEGCPVESRSEINAPRENLACFLSPKRETKTPMKIGKNYTCASIALTPKYLKFVQQQYPGMFDTLIDDMIKTPANELPSQLRPVLRTLSANVMSRVAKTSDKSLQKTVFSATALVAGSYEAALCAQERRETEEQKQLVSKVLHLIEDNIQNDLSLETLARDLYVSRAYLCAAFKEEVRLSIGSYIRMIRMEQAAHLLEDSSLSIAEISMQVGYKRQGSFSDAFLRERGVSPSQYRKLSRI